MTPSDIGSDEWVAAGAVEALAPGESVAVDVHGEAVLLCRSAGGLHAIANRCPHAAMPLTGGRIRGHYLTCPVHGARFDLKTGAASGLTRVAVRIYRTREVNGQVFVAR